MSVIFMPGYIGHLEIPYDLRVVVFPLDELPALNEVCAHPRQRTGPQDELTCAQQVDRLSIVHTDFDPPINQNAGITSAIFWRNDLVAVSVSRPDANPDQAQKTGVYVFDRQNFAQLYYYPGGYDPKNTFYPFHYTAYPDVNTYLPLRPTALLETEDGDLLVFSECGNIARLGSSAE